MIFFLDKYVFGAMRYVMVETIRTQSLKSLALRIFPGMSVYNIGQLAKSQGEIPVINIKDISGGEIKTDALEVFSVENLRNADNYLVRPGDVLIACRGTRLKIAVVPRSMGKSLITANLVAVRLDGKLSPVLLAAYLESKEGRARLLSHATSSTAQLVLNVSAVGDIIVPVPSPSLQEKMVRLLDSAREQYRLSMAAADMRRGITNQVVGDMFHEH
jgi:restriction endonuclease S subunit